jgi:hypothetical protein
MDVNGPRGDTAGIGYACQNIDSDMQWRIPLMVQIFPAVILGIGMFVLPYSPRWLAQQGEDTDTVSPALRRRVRMSNGAVASNRP